MKSVEINRELEGKQRALDEARDQVDRLKKASSQNESSKIDEKQLIDLKNHI